MIEQWRQTWPVTARGYVNPWECDDMGHMNVQFYLHHLSAARSHLALELGIDVPDVPEVIVNFRDEMPGSSSLQINSAVVGMDEEGLHIAHILTDPTQAHVSTSFFEKWPGVQASVMDHLTDEGRSMFGVDRAYRGLPDLTLGRARELGLPLGIRTQVRPSECDATGVMSQQYHISRFSDGAGFQWQAIAGENMTDMVADRRGGAVVSYQLCFRRKVRAGDLLETRLSVLHVGGSSFVLGNLLFNARTGEMIASAETVLVHFDLEARKAIPLTDGMRDNMMKNVIEIEHC